MFGKYWHYVALIGLIFVCLYVWKSKYLSGVPLVGSYLSA